MKWSRLDPSKNWTFMIPKAVSKFMSYVSIWYKKLIQKHFSRIQNQGALTLFFWYKKFAKKIFKKSVIRVFNPQDVVMKFFGAKKIYFITFDFRNGCKNELKGNNEKSGSWYKKKIFSQNRFQSRIAALRLCRQRGS